MDAAPPLQPLRRRSLAAQAADGIRAALMQGRWPTNLPSERELCEQLQVSRITVRAALTTLEREGCLRTSARRRRSTVPLRARPSSPSPLRTMVLVSSRPLAEFSAFALLLVGAMRDAVAREGFILEYRANAACYGPHPGRALEEFVAQWPAAVWILWDSMEPMQRWFVRRRLPCIVAGGCVTGISLPSVAQDFRATSRHAAGLLLRKGHRRIALVLPPGMRGGEMETEQGVRDALDSHPENALRVLRHDGTAPDLCARLGRVIRSDRPPTAYLVARAIHVPTVMMFLMASGLRLPEDVAVVSRDDEIALRHVVPEVTRYATSPEQLARSIAVAARRLAEGRHLSERTIRIVPELITGATV